MQFALSVSPCSNPEMTLSEALAHYSRLGYQRFELFTGWVQSAVNPEDDPQPYLDLSEQYGIQYSSIHLPPFMEEDLMGSVDRALQTCRLGVALGCRAAIVKARTKASYIVGGRQLLALMGDLPINPVLTNHAGSAISTLADYQEVQMGIEDPRMKSLLEVGHFHSVGVLWPDAYELLAGTIELVHIKDQIGAQSVPFGSGEIDLPGLFECLVREGYTGDVVVEMEVEDREHTLKYLEGALQFTKENTPA